MLNERIMVLRMIVGRYVLNLLSVYVHQSGRSRKEKEEFFTLLGNVVSGDRWWGEVIDLWGYEWAKVDGGYGFGKRTVDVEMLLEFADALDFAVVNTWFKKEVEGWLHMKMGRAGQDHFLKEWKKTSQGYQGIAWRSLYQTSKAACL